ncbi:MAG: bifunctional chorismate mutase/prephenate dehydrogenase, partial [Desulfobacula sp.]|nr:bifunctional chorismate mutase/prephenate dehydrogenase [Desulfobacula sp.]
MTDHTLTFETEVISLRKKIDRIDAQVLSLLEKRQAQVEKVVTLKKKHHIPVYHPAREEDLISRLRSQAQKADLDPDFMEDIYRVILRQSRDRQAGQMKYKCILRHGKVLIVGGDGQMGQFFASLFQKSGYVVRILGENDWDNAAALCADIDLCLVSVPIEITPKVIDKIAVHLPPETVLADLTSIKAGPVDVMLKAHCGPVLGLHPIFGPTTGSLDKQIIVICPGRDNKGCQWLLDQLSVWDAVIIEASAQEHDEVMEIVQALRHFATFCFGRFLYEKQIQLERTLEFSSPIYRLELGMVGRLFAQDAHLYSEIIFASPNRRNLLKDYVSSMASHLDMLENNDKQQFNDNFNEIAAWFGPFSEQDMRESTFLINKLI